jgi:hypothetical protein
MFRELNFCIRIGSSIIEASGAWRTELGLSYRLPLMFCSVANYDGVLTCRHMHH